MNFEALQQLSPGETPAFGNSLELETGCLRCDFQSGPLSSPRWEQDRSMLDFFIHCIQTCEETVSIAAKTDKAVPNCLGVLPDQVVNR